MVNRSDSAGRILSSAYEGIGVAYGKGAWYEREKGLADALDLRAHGWTALLEELRTTLMQLDVSHLHGLAEQLVDALRLARLYDTEQATRYRESTSHRCLPAPSPREQSE